MRGRLLQRSALSNMALKAVIELELLLTASAAVHFVRLVQLLL